MPEIRDDFLLSEEGAAAALPDDVHGKRQRGKKGKDGQTLSLNTKCTRYRSVHGSYKTDHTVKS